MWAVSRQGQGTAVERLPRLLTNNASRRLSRDAWHILLTPLNPTLARAPTP
jgi:hypothetical protein